MEISTLTLHHYPGTRSDRVLCVLREIFGHALDPRVTLRKVELYQGEHFREPFVSLNANRAVPVLEVAFADGAAPLVLTESAAMVAFLADAYPAAGLAPGAADLRRGAAYEEMMHFAGGHMDAQLTVLLYQGKLLKPEDRDAKTEARARKKLAEEIEPFLLKRLAAAPFAAGAAFTAADILLGHNIGWARAFGCCQDDAFEAYVKRLAERPAYAATFAPKSA